LLANRLPHLLPDARRLQHRGIRPLAQLNSGGEKRRKQSAGKDSAPVIVHLVSEARRTSIVVPFKTAEREAASVRKNDALPNRLQCTLPIPDVGIVNPYQCTSSRY
jgi:hypothetical protein